VTAHTAADAIARPLTPATAAAAAPHAYAERVGHARLLRTLALVAAALCLIVVVLGAYVRLNNAGLGCPDWPGCYGHFTPSAAASTDGDSANHLLQLSKAWREMVHRYAAGTLACLLLLLAALGIVWRRERIASPLYLTGLLAIIVVQAVLGMLTVTWQLKPLIVTLHLLFGLTTLSLLWWLVLTLWQRRSTTPAVAARVLTRARALALLGLVFLGAQIALGGWASSNYAAIACPDLPTCQGRWWPPADFHSAFVLWRGLNIDFEGGILASTARVAIHLTHRLGACATALALVAAALFCLRGGSRTLGAPVRHAAIALLLLLGLQLSIGIEMVLHGFPLWLATAHNAGAALLLLATVTLNRQLRPSHEPHPY
jgi:heme a synthase